MLIEFKRVLNVTVIIAQQTEYELVNASNAFFYQQRGFLEKLGDPVTRSQMRPHCCERLLVSSRMEKD